MSKSLAVSLYVERISQEFFIVSPSHLAYVLLRDKEVAVLILVRYKHAVCSVLMNFELKMRAVLYSSGG